MISKRSKVSASPWRNLALLPFLLMGSAFSLAVCSHDVRPCETPPPFYITLQGGPNLNPDEHHRPLPTQFLVFQLKSSARFEKADFDNLWQHPKEALADDLVQMNDVSVAPGATATVGFPRQSQAALVGVVGVFRAHTGDSWRALATLPWVPGDKCTAQPSPIKSKPSRDDVELKFEGNEDHVENRTPPPVSRGCG